VRKGAVLKRLVEFGRREMGTESPREILLALYSTRGMSLSQIAEMLNCTRPAIAYEIRQFQLPLRRQGRESELVAKIVRMGFMEAGGYFHSRQKKSFEVMAAELGLTPETVRRHHENWMIEQVRESRQ
jgi:DNA-binding CsgD family transcriptional regulator